MIQDQCYVLGCGPSLSKIDNLILDSLPTFGSNRIFKKYIPDYYACINPVEANKYPVEIEVMDCKYKFVTDKVPVPGCTPLHSTTQVDFSINPFWAVQEGYSVTFVLLQLAFFYGFREVFLLGVDHRYVQPCKPNEEITWTGRDPNHFADDYVKPGERWNGADLEKSEYYFQIAKKIFDSNGRKIINLTEGSALDVFERGVL